jgi:hypothetical protein
LPVDTAGKCGGLNVAARALSTGNIALAQIAALHLQLPDLPTLEKGAGSPEAMARLAASLYWSGLLKADWDPHKHPRTGEPPNRGWFATVSARPTVPPARIGGSFRGVAPQPVVDFSGGFHDAVVDAWVNTFRKAGIPVVRAPALRVIGPNPRVVGYPDLIIHAPGQPVEAIEVKTGANPPFTAAQQLYIPVLQHGGHIYTRDPRIRDVGLEPGKPFPPMEVYVIWARGPGLPYDVIKLPPREFVN